MEISKVVSKIEKECYLILNDDYGSYLFRAGVKPMFLVVLPYIGRVKIIKIHPSDNISICDDAMFIQRGKERFMVEELEYIEDFRYSETPYNPYKVELKSERQKKECIFLHEKGFSIQGIHNIVGISNQRIKKYLKDL